MASGISFAADITDATDITQADIQAGVLHSKQFPVSLKVAGKVTTPDVPPIIVKNRTLIPVRAVFEGIGANVIWNESTQQVDITLGTSKVKLTIDSKTAIVNGMQVSLEVPALIVEGRTMIPVRFVAEALGLSVGWDNATRTVNIDSSVVAATSDAIINISSISTKNLTDRYQVIIQGDGIISDYNAFTYSSPERFVVDISNSTLTISNGSNTTGNEIFSGIRYAQFDQDTIRIVADMNEKVAGKISLSPDKKSLYIDFYKNQTVQDVPVSGVTTVQPSNEITKGLDALDSRAAGKLVVIDAGHGGKDTGAQAIRNGVTVLKEKDINLDIALRLNNILKAEGLNTLMTRDDDTFVDLYKRPELANTAGADLFICIHNNSWSSSSVKGSSVYYYSKPSETEYGISSKQMAADVQTELIKSIGTIDRGIKSEPAYVVLNRTKMPAILIEGAFLSNDADLKLMLTDQFRQNYAYAAAKAVIKNLNSSFKSLT